MDLFIQDAYESPLYNTSVVSINTINLLYWAIIQFDQILF